MICDRVALTTEAVQYTGEAEPISRFVRHPVTSYYGRHVIITPDNRQWLFLTVGDWVIRGIGPDWDFYVVNDRKFRQLWKPRAH